MLRMCLAPLLVAAMFAGFTASALTLRGVVTDGEGAPVPGARVWAVQERIPVVTVADSEGRFAFEGIAVGGVDVVAHAEGYALGGLAAQAVGDAEVSLVLAEPASIRVRVSSAAYEPIAGARLLHATVNGAYRVPVDDLLGAGFPSVRSDDEGNLDISWIPAHGFAQLEISHHRHAQTYVPYLSAGRERQVVVMQEGHAVGGRVIDPEGGPVAAARVSIFTPTGSGLREAAQPVTAPDGFYSARVRPGEYFVAARHADFSGPPPVPLVVSGLDDARAAVIQMLPPATVTGRVQFEDGSPAPAVRVAFLTDDLVYSQAITARDGDYALEAVPGQGAVQVSPPAGHYLPGGALVEVAPAARATTRAGAVTLAPLPLIRGRVVDRSGEPVPHAVLSSYDLPTPLHAVAGADGAFAIALAFAPDHNRLVLRAEHPRHFERGLLEAELTERGEQEVRLARYEPALAVEREGWTAPNDLQRLVGKPAPALTCGQWYNSAPLSASMLRGKAVVLTFWGGFAETGATPDRLAEMRALHAAMSADDVVFLALHDSVSLPEDVAGYVSEYALTFPVAQDEDDGPSFTAYGITVIPQTIIIDRNGMVRHYDVDGRLPELIKAVLR